MQEYCMYQLGLPIKVLSNLLKPVRVRGTYLHMTKTIDYVFSKRRNILSTKTVEKLVYTSVTLVLAKDLPVQLQRPLVHY